VSVLNPYADEAQNAAGVANGEHRDMIGGMWEEIGALQFDFLVHQGMRPHHKLLDLGCGAGRLAVRAVPYLQGGGGVYHGVDLSASLLSAAHKELEAIGAPLSPRDLHATADFTPGPGAPSTFDFGIAQSLFTHLPRDCFEQALRAIAPWFGPASRFFATFFIGPANAAELRHEPSGVVSHPDRDPFHYDADAIVAAAMRNGWRVESLGAWDHPRDQQMCALRRH
jgi:SAM-dependent methyltransferase